MITRLFLLAAAGAAGALSRYVLSSLIQRHTPGLFPLATLAINLAGCFLFGLLWALAEQRHLIPPEWRAVLLTGFLGAFTTFSSFAYENAQLLRHGQLGLLAVNVVVQNLLGVVLVLAGMQLGRGANG